MAHNVGNPTISTMRTQSLFSRQQHAHRTDHAPRVGRQPFELAVLTLKGLQRIFALFLPILLASCATAPGIDTAYLQSSFFDRPAFPKAASFTHLHRSLVVGDSSDEVLAKLARHFANRNVQFRKNRNGSLDQLVSAYERELAGWEPAHFYATALRLDLVPQAAGNTCTVVTVYALTQSKPAQSPQRQLNPDRSEVWSVHSADQSYFWASSPVFQLLEGLQKMPCLR